MAIYVITHKYMDRKPVLSGGYKWMYVGAYKQSEREKSYEYDDIGVQISNKNDNYCELTGVYWIWHNCHDEIKGISHYRRFFTHNRFSDKEEYFYSDEELISLLKNNDCIVSERLYLPYGSVKEHYKKEHYAKDLVLLEDVIKDIMPEYFEAYKEAFSKDYLFPYNMIVAKAEIFNEYCDWLFTILNELEAREDISNYSAYQARVYGFISERLLNVWLIKNKVNYKEIPVIQVSGRLRYRIRLWLEKIFGRSLHFLAQMDSLCEEHKK